MRGRRCYARAAGNTWALCKHRAAVHATCEEVRGGALQMPILHHVHNRQTQAPIGLKRPLPLLTLLLGSDCSGLLHLVLDLLINLEGRVRVRLLGFGGEVADHGVSLPRGHVWPVLDLHHVGPEENEKHNGELESRVAPKDEPRERDAKLAQDDIDDPVALVGLEVVVPVRWAEGETCVSGAEELAHRRVRNAGLK